MIVFNGATRVLSYSMNLGTPQGMKDGSIHIDQINSSMLTSGTEKQILGNVIFCIDIFGTYFQSLPDIDDLFEVSSMLCDEAVRWRQIGLALRIRDPELDQIAVKFNNDPENCLREMLKHWLKQSFDTEKYGKPSWETLSEAVRLRSGGNNSVLAQKIGCY